MAETKVQIAYQVSGLQALAKANTEMQKAQGATGGAANGIKAFGGAAQAAGPAVQGLGAAIQSALGPLLAIGTAIGIVKKGLDDAFAQGAAEQRLKNFTGSTEEYEAALGVATVASQRFGVAQGETTQALADVYTRLTPLGFGLKEVSDTYIGFNTIAKQSGATADASAAAFLQLSQALGSGRLQGDEFRSVAEQVPGILKLVADQMGVNVGQLKALSSEGKITSDVIVAALETAANAGGDFSSSLTEAQRAQNALNVTLAKMSTQIGEAFAPAALAVMEGMSWAAQKISEWWDYIGGVLWPAAMKAIEPVTKELEKIVSGIDWDFFRTLWQNVMIKALELATWHLGNLSKVAGFVLRTLQEMAQNPVFKFIAEQVGRLVGLLGLAEDKVGEYAKEQQEAAEEAANNAKNFSGIPEKITNAKDAAKALKEEFAAGKQEIQAMYAEMTNLLDIQQAAGDQAFTLRQSELETQARLNDLQLQGLQTELEKAKTYGDKVRIIGQMYELEKANAALAYESAMEQIANDERLAVLAVERNTLKLAELEAERALAIAKGQSTAALDAAISKQATAVELAGQQLELTRALGDNQSRVAEGVYQSAMRAVDLARETRLADAAAKSMEQAARGIAASTAAAAGSAQQYAGAMNSAANASGGGGYGVSYDMRNLTPGEQAEMQRRIQDAMKGSLPSWDGASGSIGQSRVNDIKNEYFELSASRGRMLAAQQEEQAQERWRNLASSSSATGIGAPQVNITNTGPVMRFNDTDYVRSQDVPGIVDQAVGQTFSTLEGNSSMRFAAGVGA